MIFARVFLVVAVVIWGWTFIATKVCLRYLSPAELLSLRFQIVLRAGAEELLQVGLGLSQLVIDIRGADLGQQLTLLDLVADVHQSPTHVAGRAGEQDRIGVGCVECAGNFVWLVCEKKFVSQPEFLEQVIPVCRGARRLCRSRLGRHWR